MIGTLTAAINWICGQGYSTSVKREAKEGIVKKLSSDSKAVHSKVVIRQYVYPEDRE